MSVPDAYGLIRPHLPQETTEKADAKIAALASTDEVTFDGFSLWKVKDAANLAFITERRSRACVDQDLRLALGQQHKLLVGALQKGTEDQLWQAFFRVDGKIISLLLNLARPRFQIQFLSHSLKGSI